MFESDSHFDCDDHEVSNIIPLPNTNKRSLHSSSTHNGPNKKQRPSSNSCVSDQTGELLKKLDVNKSFNAKVVSRKFPGPAGLLPGLIDDNKTANVRSTKANPEVLCSQMSVNVFWEGPWEHMIKDFQPTSTNDICLPDKYNIAWIKRVVKDNKLINQKAPFLAGIIENIKCSKTKPVLTFSFILKDATGKMRSTLTVSNDLYEEYTKLLTNGAVIILKQFGVLINENDSVHITTTSNNLVRIYTQNEVIIMQDFVVSDFLQKLKELKLKHKLNVPKFVESPIRPQLSLQNKTILPFSINPIINTNNFNCTENSNSNNKRKFNFKQKSVIPDTRLDKITQNTSNVDDSPVNAMQQIDIVKNVFEGVDTDALFDDF